MKKRANGKEISDPFKTEVNYIVRPQFLNGFSDPVALRPKLNDV